MLMNEREINDILQRIQNNWGEQTLRGDRLKRIKTALGSISYARGMQVVDSLVDTLKTAPTPNDFILAARPYKQTNNSHDQNSGNSMLTDPIKCQKCFDIGIVFVRDSDNIQTLMRCQCDFGKESSEALPQWESNIGAAYPIQEFPVAWFKPQIDPNDPEKTDKTFYKKVFEWRAEIKYAKQYWNTKIGTEVFK